MNAKQSACILRTQLTEVMKDFKYCQHPDTDQEREYYKEIVMFASFFEATLNKAIREFDSVLITEAKEQKIIESLFPIVSFCKDVKAHVGELRNA